MKFLQLGGIYPFSTCHFVVAFANVFFVMNFHCYCCWGWQQTVEWSFCSLKTQMIENKYICRWCLNIAIYNVQGYFQYIFKHIKLVWIFCDNKTGCYNNHLKVNTWRQLEDHWQRERREERPSGLSFLLPPLLPLLSPSYKCFWEAVLCFLKKKKIWSNKIIPSSHLSATLIYMLVSFSNQSVSWDPSPDP